MDLIAIGEFIAELRHEKKMTQEELGEKIGVTNKTISRWENGDYLPSVDALQLLSKEFLVSINELLSGKRIEESKYKHESERNICEVLSKSQFTVKEKSEFWKKKWLKHHKYSLLCISSIIVGFFMYGIVIHNDFWIAGSILTTGITYIILYNKMMAYVEKNTY